MSEDQIKEIESLSKKNIVVAAMFSEWKIYCQSPHLDSYITLLKQLEDWNAQLEIKKVDIYGEDRKVIGTKMQGRIDLFADKDTKEFDRAFKYFSDITTLLDALDAIRAKMNPQQQKEADKISKNKSIAI